MNKFLAVGLGTVLALVAIWLLVDGYTAAGLRRAGVQLRVRLACSSGHCSRSRGRRTP